MTNKPERPQCPICGRKISTPETCECSDNKYWVEQGKRLANDELMRILGEK